MSEEKIQFKLLIPAALLDKLKTEAVAAKRSISAEIICRLERTLERPTLPKCSAEQVEAVDHPPHYGGADDPFEVIKVMEAWLTQEEFIGAMKFNIIKYQARAAKKNGRQDYEKSAWYAHRLADYLERNPA